MLKGKSTIEMTDVHTGKKEIYRDENLVTEAIADILNTNIQGAMKCSLGTGATAKIGRTASLLPVMIMIPCSPR